MHQSYKKSPKEKRKSLLIKYAVYAVIGTLIIAVIAGKIHWLGAVAAGALGFLKVSASSFLRFMPFLSGLNKNKLFGNPVFNTPFLTVTLDLQTGRTFGTIRKGEFSGREILDLNEEEIETLSYELQKNDKRGYYLIQVIRKQNNKNYQSHNQNNAYDSELSEPSFEESEMMLGLPKEYTKKDVDMAYKRLMQKLHPDRGGNDYLASRINIARDTLIKHLSKKN